MRLRAFKLSEVPEPIRLRASERLLRAEGRDPMLPLTASFEDRLELGTAAAHPSDRTYWVSQSAWDRVVGKAGAK